MRTLRLFACLAATLAVAGGVHAQSSREAQRKLERMQHELQDVAAQRRQIAGQRTDATRQLRVGFMITSYSSPSDTKSVVLVTWPVRRS